MSDKLEDLFDEDKLNKAIKKGKLKASIRTITISLVVTIIVLTVGSYFNTKISLKMGKEAFERNEEWIKLTVPNGYISKSMTNIGFLGGKETYTVSKAVGYKPIVVQERDSIFGFSFNNPILKFLGYSQDYPLSYVSGGYVAQKNEDGWYINYSENGYRKMMFFHPDINYKGYKDDLGQLDEIGDDKSIELAISFDKPYKYYEVESMFRNKVNVSWYWLDAFTKEDMKNFKKLAELQDGNGAYIDEFNAIGVNASPQSFETGYADLMNLLANTKLEKYKAIYNEMIDKGYKDKNYYDVPILGAIVYGTKSELEVLKGDPAIKASSFGVITSKY